MHPTSRKPPEKLAGVRGRFSNGENSRYLRLVFNTLSGVPETLQKAQCHASSAKPDHGEIAGCTANERMKQEKPLWQPQQQSPRSRKSPTFGKARTSPARSSKVRCAPAARRWSKSRCAARASSSPRSTGRNSEEAAESATRT